LPGPDQEAADAAESDRRASRDEALLERVRQADREAYAELVGLHFDAVYRVAWRTLGGSDGAEDVAQETFLKLWRNPQSLRRGTALRGWLMRVAVNLAIDRHRRRRPIAEVELAEVADEREGADVELRRREAAAEIDGAIAQLPQRQRTALLLSHFEALGNPEIAAAMEITVEAVESLLSRARRALRIALADRWREMLTEMDSL
jgi:RNA polymerase sigma-70 factor (ECF subfamily)